MSIIIIMVRLQDVLYYITSEVSSWMDILCCLIDSAVIAYQALLNPKNYKCNVK